MKKLMFILLLFPIIAFSRPLYTVVKDSPGSYSVFFGDTIQGSDYYTKLYMLMIKIKPKKLTLYLSGYGGRVDTLLDLFAIKEKLGIKFHAVVYGNVYSAHAMLALNSDSIEVYNDNIFFMIHAPAVGGLLPKDNCNKYWWWETDRGQSKKVKCLIRHNYEQILFNNLILSNVFSILNKKEREMYWQGHDIYMPWYKLRDRLK